MPKITRPARPLVQRFINKAVIQITNMLVKDPTDQGFTTVIESAISKTGPFDAVIYFPEGADMYWKGKKLGHVALPPLQARSGKVNKLTVEVPFSIENPEILASFMRELLMETKFNLELRTDKLTVHALGVPFTKLKFRHTVTMKGFGGMGNVLRISDSTLLETDAKGRNTVPPALIKDQQRISVEGFDVIKGTEEGLTIKLGLVLPNTSNVTAELGEIKFNLTYEGHPIGDVFMPSVTLAPGSNHVSSTVQYSPKTPAAIAAGERMLSKHMERVDNTVRIAGGQPVQLAETLNEIFSRMTFEASVPPMPQNVVVSTTMTSPADVLTTGKAHGVISMDNPFSIPIDLQSVKGTVFVDDFVLGRIAWDASPTESWIFKSGSSSSSPTIPIMLDLDSKNLNGFLLSACQQKNVKLPEEVRELLETYQAYDPKKGPMTLKMPHTPTTSLAMPSARTSIDLPSLVFKALQDMHVHVSLSTKAKLGVYTTSLKWIQKDVSVQVDKSISGLIGAVAKPLMQTIVQGAKIDVIQATICDMTEDGMALDLRCTITNVGSVDASLKVVKPFGLMFKSQRVADVMIDDVESILDAAKPFNLKGSLRIVDVEKFSEFCAGLIHSEEAPVELKDGIATVVVAGTILEKVPVSMNLALPGLNDFQPFGRQTPSGQSLPPSIQLSNVQVVEGTPDYARITAIAKLTNSSKLRLEIPAKEKISFAVQYEGVDIGRATLSNIPSPDEKTRLKNANKLIIDIGENVVDCEFRFTPPSDPELKAKANVVLEKFVRGQSSNVTVIGDINSSPLPSVTAALSNLRQSAEIVPGEEFTNGLIKSIRAKVMVTTVLTNTSTASFIMNNPFLAEMRLHGVTLRAFYKGEPLVSAQATFSNPISIPGCVNNEPQSGGSPSFSVNLIPQVQRLVALVLPTGGKLALDVDASVDAEIGGFRVKGLKYQQLAVPAVLQGLGLLRPVFNGKEPTENGANEIPVDFSADRQKDMDRELHGIPLQYNPIS